METAFKIAIVAGGLALIVALRRQHLQGKRIAEIGASIRKPA